MPNSLPNPTDVNAPDAVTVSRQASSRRTPRRRMMFAAVYTIYLCLLCGLALSLYFWLQYDVGVTGKLSVKQLWQIHYPKLETVRSNTTQTHPEDGRFDVLLLGASVLEQIVEPLQRRLPEALPKPIRIHNLCTAAHTSRDSYLKFQRLADLGAEFDLIIVYHGINEARMNCCRQRDFRNDYTHCEHYETIERHLRAGEATATDIAMRDLGNLISIGEPSPQLIDFGAIVKTAKPFRRNIEAIVQRSQSKDTPVLLMTFAWHLPPDYTRQAFENQTLDYGVGQYDMPAEVWGRPAHLRATLADHNQQIQSLARAYANVRFVDQRQQLAGNGRYFSDPCHLTDEGIQQFIDNMLPAIAQTAKPEHE